MIVYQAIIVQDLDEEFIAEMSPSDIWDAMMTPRPVFSTLSAAQAFVEQDIRKGLDEANGPDSPATITWEEKGTTWSVTVVGLVNPPELVWGVVHECQVD